MISSKVLLLGLVLGADLVRHGLGKRQTRVLSSLRGSHQIGPHRLGHGHSQSTQAKSTHGRNSGKQINAKLPKSSRRLSKAGHVSEKRAITHFSSRANQNS